MSICTAKCLAHYENLWTFELRYPRIIHSEFMTHRVFSRNASSSRAIPVKNVIEDVWYNGYVPNKVFKNKPGMVGDEELSQEEYTKFLTLWDSVADYACEVAEKMNEIGVHKQHINRILEPFSYISVIVTATEWSNFFLLRLAEDAQPEIRELALAIYKEMLRVGNREVGLYKTRTRDVISLPYVTADEMGSIKDYKKLMKISAARCARVSYNNHDGSSPDIEKDLKLYERLKEGGHMSPMEHPCIMDPQYGKHANLSYWKSLRYLLEKNLI